MSRVLHTQHVRKSRITATKVRGKARKARDKVRNVRKIAPDEDLCLLLHIIVMLDRTRTIAERRAKG